MFHRGSYRCGKCDTCFNSSGNRLKLKSLVVVTRLELGIFPKVNYRKCVIFACLCVTTTVKLAISEN